MGSTVINAYSYPEGSDPPVTPAQLAAALEQVARGGVMFFASAAARTAAFSRLGISPTAGMVSYLQDTGCHEFYDGTEWYGSPTPYVPTHANLVVGAGGSVVARWKRYPGKTADVFWMVTLGAGFTVGTLPSFTLPFTLHSRYVALTQIGVGELFDTGLASYFAMGRWTGSAVEVVYPGVSGIHTAVGAASPFGWVAGDRLFIEATGLEMA